jgi:tetratricopeptide (TPR) repeat protein
MPALPKSLQARIEDAQRCLEHWDDDEQPGDDGMMDYVKEWTERLSRGEYDQRLYWECVAEDCEAEGDWEGAKNAYRRLIEIETDDQHGFLPAHSALAGLHSMLGEMGPALVHARSATAIEERNPATRIAFRCAIVQEAWLLLRAGRIRAARRLIKRGLAAFEEDCPDDLGYAKLATAWAACEVAARRADGADEWLQCAWSYLDAMREALDNDVDGGADTASGLQAAYSTWWDVEAERRRLTGDGPGEVEAWAQAVACARRAATGWNSVGWDASVMRALRSLASAQQRQGLAEDAAKNQAEAEEIRQRWRLPMFEAPELTDEPNPRSGWFRSLLRELR